MAAMFVVADAREIGVIARPIERVCHRAQRDDRVKRRPDPVHERQQRILAGAQQRAGDDENPHAEARGQRDDHRADEKAPREDGGECQEHAGHGDAGLEQIGREKRAGAGHGDGVDRVVDVEKIDRVVAEVSHGTASVTKDGSNAHEIRQQPWIHGRPDSGLFRAFDRQSEASSKRDCRQFSGADKVFQLKLGFHRSQIGCVIADRDRILWAAFDRRRRSAPWI